MRSMVNSALWRYFISAESKIELNSNYLLSTLKASLEFLVQGQNSVNLKPAFDFLRIRNFLNE
jgi:hypothetical protein